MPVGRARARARAGAAPGAGPGGDHARAARPRVRAVAGTAGYVRRCVAACERCPRSGRRRDPPRRPRARARAARWAGRCGRSDAKDGTVRGYTAHARRKPRAQVLSRRRGHSASPRGGRVGCAPRFVRPHGADATIVPGRGPLRRSRSRVGKDCLVDRTIPIHARTLGVSVPPQITVSSTTARPVNYPDGLRRSALVRYYCGVALSCGFSPTTRVTSRHAGALDGGLFSSPNNSEVPCEGNLSSSAAWPPPLRALPPSWRS